MLFTNRSFFDWRFSLRLSILGRRERLTAVSEFSSTDEDTHLGMQPHDRRSTSRVGMRTDSRGP